jgi:hypothetical protein
MKTYDALSIVSYIVGGAGFLFGLDVLLDWPIPVRSRALKKRVSWSLTPQTVAGGGASVLFDLRFP